MQRYGQKTSKIPPKWGFSPICDPKIFFQKSGSVTFVPLSCPNLIKIQVIYAKCQRNVDGKLSQNTRTLYRLKTYLLMAKQRQYTRKHYRPLYRYNISKEESIDYQ